MAAAALSTRSLTISAVSHAVNTTLRTFASESARANRSAGITSARKFSFSNTSDGVTVVPFGACAVP